MSILDKKISTIAIFYLSSALLIVYLLSIRWQVHLPVITFWVAISLMLGTIVYQILNVKSDSNFTKIVLLEIVTTCLIVHMIYLIPYYGIRGTDAYKDMSAVKGIVDSGFVVVEPKYGFGVYYFPIIHILGAELSMFTDIGVFTVVKWFPPIIDVALVLLLYLFVRHLFKEERVALLSTLMFSLLQHHILFSALFVRETIALVLAVGCVYLYFSARSSEHPLIRRTLAIIFLAGTVIAHHLTSFSLFMFLLVHFLATKISELSFISKILRGHKIVGNKITPSFLLLAFVAPSAYWIPIVKGPLYTLNGFMTEVFSPNRWGVDTYGEVANVSGAAIQTMRGEILFYGFYLFHLAFGAILLYHLIFKARENRLETYSFSLFLFFTGVAGLGVIYLLTIGNAPNPDRFLMYGWLFAAAPLVVAILKLGHNWVRGICILLLLTFMLFNIYLIEPTAWDTRAEGVPYVSSEEDYTLANSFDFSEGEITGHPNNLMAIFDVHDNFGINPFESLEAIALSDFDWVIIHKEALELELKNSTEPRAEVIVEMEQLSKEDSPERNRIFESNGFTVFKSRR